MTDGKQRLTVTKRKGEPTEGFTEEFAREVYNRCPIFQHRDFTEFFTTTKGFIEGEDRIEYLVKSEGKVKASMAIIKETDMHVGECMSVLLALSVDNGLLRDGYKVLIKVAKQLGVKFVAYTKDISEYESDTELDSGDLNEQCGGKMISQQSSKIFNYHLTYRRVA